MAIFLIIQLFIEYIFIWEINFWIYNKCVFQFKSYSVNSEVIINCSNSIPWKNLHRFTWSWLDNIIYFSVFSSNIDEEQKFLLSVGQIKCTWYK